MMRHGHGVLSAGLEGSGSLALLRSQLIELDRDIDIERDGMFAGKVF